MKSYYDPSVHWDYHLNRLDYDVSYDTNEYSDKDHVEYVKCSLDRLDEWGFTLIYSYDRETKRRLTVDCVVTTELLRDGI